MSTGNLVGLSRIASLLGVAPDQVNIWWREYSDFPHPVEATPLGPLWAAAEVERWAEGRGWRGSRLSS